MTSKTEDHEEVPGQASYAVVEDGADSVRPHGSAPADTLVDAPAGEPPRELSDVDRDLLERASAQDQAEAISGSGDEQPAPDPWQTTWTELDLRCGKCNIIHYVPICIFLNAEESPHLVQRIVSGHFNVKRCPLCRKTEFVEYPFTYFDPARKLAVQVRPEWEWHAGGGDEWYAARLEDFFERWAEHDVRIDVVFGPEKFVERYLADQPAPPARR